MHAHVSLSECLFLVWPPCRPSSSTFFEQKKGENFNSNSALISSDQTVYLDFQRSFQMLSNQPIAADQQLGDASGTKLTPGSGKVSSEQVMDLEHTYGAHK
jgi:hypothetical protein